MQMKVGPIEVKAEIDGIPSPELLNLTMKYLQDAQTLLGPGVVHPVIQVNPAQAPPPPATTMKPIDSLTLLKAIGLTNHTITKVANKTLDVQTSGAKLLKSMPEIEKASCAWLDRPITDQIWAVFIGPVKLPKLGERTATIGLNKTNNLIILGLSEKPPVEAVESLVARGLNPRRVRFVMPAFDSGLSNTDIKKIFPKTKIGADWQEFLQNASDEDAKEEIKEAMTNPNPNEAAKVVDEYDGPAELLTYYEFDRELWRILRSSNALVKFRRELKSKLRENAVDATREIQLATAWAALRLQYQWLKFPADAKFKDNLTEIRMRMQEV